MPACVRACVCMFVYVCARACVCVYACTCMCVCVHARMRGGGMSTFLFAVGKSVIVADTTRCTPGKTSTAVFTTSSWENSGLST